MNQKTFEKGIKLLISTFPDRHFDMECYWELLKDMDDDTYLMAVKDICSTQRELYPGTNLIAMIRENKVKNESIEAGEAWGRVMKEISRVGHMGCPKFGDPITHKAVNCIGWKTVCISSNIMVDRAHFLKIYEQLKNRHTQEQKQLPEITNFYKNGDVKQLIEQTAGSMVAKDHNPDSGE